METVVAAGTVEVSVASAERHSAGSFAGIFQLVDSFAGELVD